MLRMRCQVCTNELSYDENSQQLSFSLIISSNSDLASSLKEIIASGRKYPIVLVTYFTYSIVSYSQYAYAIYKFYA
jgi:hypothetical protein